MSDWPQDIRRREDGWPDFDAITNLMHEYVWEHPIPESIDLLFLRHYHHKHPWEPSPDADPSHPSFLGGRYIKPINPFDHCRWVLMGKYVPLSRRDVADRMGMPLEYIEALEKYLAVSLQSED
jgi:hypothetical protein